MNILNEFNNLPIQYKLILIGMAVIFLWLIVQDIIWPEDVDKYRLQLAEEEKKMHEEEIKEILEEYEKKQRQGKL